MVDYKMLMLVPGITMILTWHGWLLLQEKKLRELGKKHNVNISVVKSRNGAISLEGDTDGIASVIDELMQLMFEMKDRAASEREAELLAKQVAFNLILYYNNNNNNNNNWTMFNMLTSWQSHILTESLQEVTHFIWQM